MNEKRYQRGTLVQTWQIVQGVLPEGLEVKWILLKRAELQELALHHSLSSVVLVKPCFPQQIHSLQFHLQAQVIKRVACFLRKPSPCRPPWLTVASSLCCSLISYWAYSWSWTSYRLTKDNICQKAFIRNSPAQPPNSFLSRFKASSRVYKTETNLPVASPIHPEQPALHLLPIVFVNTIWASVTRLFSSTVQVEEEWA